MSHVGNGEHDFDGLDDLGLSADTLESVQQARIEARSIIDSLEPLHIDSWADLFSKLENCLERAKRAYKVLGPISMRACPGLETEEAIATVRKRLNEATEESFRQLDRAKRESWQET